MNPTIREENRRTKWFCFFKGIQKPTTPYVWIRLIVSKSHFLNVLTSSTSGKIWVELNHKQKKFSNKTSFSRRCSEGPLPSLFDNDQKRNKFSTMVNLKFCKIFMKIHLMLRDTKKILRDLRI